MAITPARIGLPDFDQGVTHAAPRLVADPTMQEDARTDRALPRSGIVMD